MPLELKVIIAPVMLCMALAAFFEAAQSTADSSTAAPTTSPTPQLTIPCQIVRVIDGDTIVVEIKTRFTVRLLDCWAAETKETGIPGEKARGIKAAEAMRTIADGKPGVVSIPLPADPDTSLASVMTLGRVLGRVSVDEGDLSEIQRAAGHAFLTKELLHGSLNSKER